MSLNRSEADLRVWLRDAVAELLEIDADDIDPDRPLTELGISSRDAVGLVGDLEDYLDRDLDATLVWQTPTISALATLLAAGDEPALQPDNAASGAAVASPSTPMSDASSAPLSPAGREPVAIIGVGCRLPGQSTGPDAYWDLLTGARDAVGEVPEGRWNDFAGPGTPGFESVGRTNRTGGFLGDVSGFDADYFGISPREAELMDPQQRMLLELVVEAMDHAGLRPEDLRGSDTGVFVGMSTNEYSHLTTADLNRIDAWTATGSAFSIAANRISYLFDLRGPSMTLDTACSSSLVAIHQACRSIADGEISQAFVAGVNLLLSPAITMTFDQAGALSEAGGSKPFSDDADGIARAEGAGVVVLKRLSSAQADGDRILAVVRATGVNSDGRSNGLTAPNPVAQEALLRRVYAGAGIDPAAVDYVEAHGTGTLLGDPIEAAALGAALGTGREPDKPLLLGSVKSNLGHLESAAGMAGVIKVVLGMQHDLIPASLKYAGPNPHIRFADWRLSVVQNAQPWPRYSGRALAGVSGFGFGGTNAHVVIEEWPAAAPVAQAPSDDRPVALPLSGLTQDRVRERAGALAAWLTGPGTAVPLADVEHTLTRRRGRALSATVVSARGRAALAQALEAYAGGAEPAQMPPGTVALPPVPRTAATRPGTERAVWVFSGWGSQWTGMGAQLLADEPAFAASIDELEPLVQAEAGFSLRAAMSGAMEGRIEVAGVAAVQIVVFSIQVSLAALWRSYGVQPAAVIGHSLGEVAAAVAVGGLSTADGVRVISARSRLLEALERVGSGAMAVVELDAAELDRVSARFPDVGVCVYGSPSQLTVGGPDAGQVDGLVQYVESLGRNAWPLKVRAAGHSPAVDVILPDLREQLTGITGGTSSVPFYSAAMDDPRTPVTFDVEYWLRNVRQPVRFSQAVAAAEADGHVAYLEISPHPIALSAIKQTIAGRVGSELLLTGTLRRDGDDGVVFRANAMALQQAGLVVGTDRLVPVAPQASIPDRVWRHRRFWVESPAPVVPLAAVDGHPLLGVHVELPEGGRHLWRADLGTARLPWLNDHQLFGVPVLPVAAYAEMALAAGREILAAGLEPGAVELSELDLTAMMSLGDHTDVTTSLTVLAAGAAKVEIYARPPGVPATAPMIAHASVTVRRVDTSADVSPSLDVDLSAAESGQPVDLYGLMRAAGHEYGPSFIGVSQARVTREGVAMARVIVPDAVASNHHFTVHPVLLDSCLQSLVVSGFALLDADDADLSESETILPAGVGAIRIYADPGREALVTAQLLRSGEGELTGSVRVVSESGQLLMEIRDVLLRSIDAAEVPVPLPGSSAADEVDGAGSWPGPDGLRTMSPAAARQALADRLRTRVAMVMGHRPDEIDVNAPLSSLGVDSLVAMRAKNAVEQDVGVTMPVRLLLQGASLAGLEAYLATALGIESGAAPVVREASKADVEARDGTERWLVSAWAQVVGSAPASVTTPVSQFGDAEAARQVTALILSRLETQPGAMQRRAQWPAEEDLLGASTIEEQADLVRDLIEHVGDSPLRVLSSGDAGERPLFVFHPAGGTTSVYYPMVSQLEDSVPVYGLERLDGLRGIDDKVTQYLQLIRSVQAAGPYRLGGWSFGGALAYRTAQQLRDQGEEVELLFMIDTILVRQDDQAERDMLAGRFERFIEYLESTYALDLDIDVQWLVDLEEHEQIATLLRKVEESGAGLSPALLEHQRTSYEDARIAEKFVPSIYGSGPVVLYRSSERGLTTSIDPRYARTEDSLGWDVFCSDLEVVHVPGNHTSMIDRPQVDTMALHLSQALSSLGSIGSLSAQPKVAEVVRRA